MELVAMGSAGAAVCSGAAAPSSLSRGDICAQQQQQQQQQQHQTRGSAVVRGHGFRAAKLWNATALERAAARLPFASSLDNISRSGGRHERLPTPQFGRASCLATAGEENGELSGHAQEPVARREVIGKAVTFLVSALALPVMAAAEVDTEEGFMLYEDGDDKYRLLVPQDWAKGQGNAGQRKITAFYPDGDTNANVNVVITGLGADYTGLGSFGTADIFAENLVNGLDRAWKRPPGQAAKLIDTKSKNGMYYVEYTIQKPGEAKRHFLSVVGIASNGWINRLYTVTGQYWEDDAEKYKTTLTKAVQSFTFI